MKIAVVGAGVSGIVAARELYGGHEVTVFEAGAHVGGHAHTQRVEAGGQRFEVDTGFMVYNHRTYPHFTRMLAGLGVEGRASTMSFSVRDARSGLEYNGESLDGLYAQRRNLLRPSFHAMLAEILRFHRVAPRLLEEAAGELPLRDYLAREGYRRDFTECYLLPLVASIWSADPAALHDFPARFLVRFLHNHGMLTVNRRPTWYTVQGGSARYVERLIAPFRHRIHCAQPVERLRRIPGGVMLRPRGHDWLHYDAVFMACHADQALALLEDASAAEREVLGAIRFRRNSATLHTDASLLPRTPRARAAWNYLVRRGTDRGAVVTYDLALLQGHVAPMPLLLTLNDDGDVAASKVLRVMEYEHPQFTAQAVAAQARQREIDGPLATYYCGAWWRNGFHEDGVASALEALAHFRADHAQRALHRSA